MKSRLGQTI